MWAPIIGETLCQTTRCEQVWYEPTSEHIWGHWHDQVDKHCTLVKTCHRCSFPVAVAGEAVHHGAEDEIEAPSGTRMRRCVRGQILGASRLLEGRFVASDVQGMSAALNLEGTLAQLGCRGGGTENRGSGCRP